MQDVTIDCLLALVHLKSFNIAHLDVKPQNILRSENGVYKLADFSVTVDLNKKESSSGEFGTGRYAAPELLNGNFSTKADLYSLGISLSQVSVSADAPLTTNEWTEMKDDGKLPNRVSAALTGSFGLAGMVQSMISEYSSRPSAKELHPNNHRETTLEESKKENMFLRESIKNMHFRHSLSSSCERKLRENKSPLINLSI
ncbi:hypothetical protein PRIPAC_71720 [Pristionchus pacificus]|nr:hypothetical protein PRIPAC_71720 [Pristionchus pacificus]